MLQVQTLEPFSPLIAGSGVAVLPEQPPIAFGLQAHLILNLSVDVHATEKLVLNDVVVAEVCFVYLSFIFPGVSKSC